MTAVIAFPQDRVRPRSDSQSQASAEVIIFPGVRVERLACEVVERKPLIRSGPQQAAHATDFDFY